MQTFETIDGNEAAARVAYALNEVIAIYPITPATPHGIDRIRIIEEEMIAWMQEHEYKSVEQLKGSLSHKNCPDPSAFERAQYMRAWESTKHHSVTAAMRNHRRPNARCQTCKADKPGRGATSCRRISSDPLGCVFREVMSETEKSGQPIQEK